METERGLKEFLSVFTSHRTTKSGDIIKILGHLLTHADADCILNATGTLGTIVCRFEILKTEFFEFLFDLSVAQKKDEIYFSNIILFLKSFSMHRHC